MPGPGYENLERLVTFVAYVVGIGLPLFITLSLTYVIWSIIKNRHKKTKE